MEIKSIYHEVIQKNYSTQIGEVTVKNLLRGPFGEPLEALMTTLRDERTESDKFRELVKYIYGAFVIPEFLRTLDTQEVKITTGNKCAYKGMEYVPTEIVVIDIPTAGTAATELMLDTMNMLNRLGDRGFEIHKGVIDITRIEKGDGIVHDKKRVKMRNPGRNTYAVFADVMNATGGTLETAVKEVLDPVHYKEGGKVSRVFIAPIISSADGVCNVATMLNEIEIPSYIVSVAIDPTLDSRKYIVPGLGDAGDRLNNR